MNLSVTEGHSSISSLSNRIYVLHYGRDTVHYAGLSAIAELLVLHYFEQSVSDICDISFLQSWFVDEERIFLGSSGHTKIVWKHRG